MQAAPERQESVKRRRLVQRSLLPQYSPIKPFRQWLNGKNLRDNTHYSNQREYDR
jgi:hypothetical protein